VKVRAVRVAFHFGERMMLAMHRNPLSPGQSGGEPNRESENEGHGGMELERLVRGASMKINRGAEHRYLRDERRDTQTPQQRPEHSKSYHA
jgi:hypothetical protein